MRPRVPALAIVLTAISVAACSVGPASSPGSPVSGTAFHSPATSAPPSTDIPAGATSSAQTAITRDAAIAIARAAEPTSASDAVARAESGPYAQFFPAPPGKGQAPAPDRQIWDVKFGGTSVTKEVAIDYWTGDVLEVSLGAA